MTSQTDPPPPPEGWPEHPDACYQRVHRLCRSLLNSPDEAQEVAQTTMLQLHKNLDRFEGRSSFATYAYAAALNAVRTFRRGRKRERAHFTSEEPQFERIPGGVLPPPDAVTRSERDRLVREALEAMPPEYREALILRVIEKLSYREIAELLGCPLGTVKSRLHNGLIKLGRRLQGVRP